MVVIAIVSVLAAIAAPGYVMAIDKSKWSEANAGAGAVRTAVIAYAAETSVADAQDLAGENLGSADLRQKLGFNAGDLDGTFFEEDDYTINSVNARGVAVVTVTGGSKPNSPAGSYQLELDGGWQKQ